MSLCKEETFIEEHIDVIAVGLLLIWFIVMTVLILTSECEKCCCCCMEKTNETIQVNE